MDYSYDKEDPECKIITMESIVSMVLTTASTDTQDLTNNPSHCVDPHNIKPGAYYFFEKAHCENYGKWVITYNAHYKVINYQSHNVKYPFLNFSIPHMEHAHGGQHFFLSTTFQDDIVKTQKTQILHLELLVL